MEYYCYFNSPLGSILLVSDDIGLCELYLDTQCGYNPDLPASNPEDFPALHQATAWLDEYFCGKVPAFTPPLHLVGTDFQLDVWRLLLAIPYGRTVTYGEIAKQLVKNRGIEKMSAQAVGNAVGANKISIIVPCHRVLGKGGRLTGYQGGLDKKSALLKIEKII